MPRTRIGWGALPLAAVFLGGCGSSWTIPNDVLSTLSLAWYYPDVDGDGWGDPGGEPEQLASPDVGGGLTATNDRDCAADDDQITGQIGAICPDDLAFGGTVSGVSYPGDGTAEYVMTHGGDAPTPSASLAETDCGLWGSTVASETLPFGAGQLASIQVAVELDPLAEIAQRDGAFAGWIGIGWSTGDPEQGEWVWVDGSDKGSIQAEFNWCAGSPPSPYSLFPFAVLNPDDPNQAAVIAADLPGKRLALVWAPDATEWCLGLPTDAIGPSVPWTEGAYTVDNAHMVCERPYLDPAAFVSKPAPADAPAP